MNDGWNIGTLSDTAQCCRTRWSLFCKSIWMTPGNHKQLTRYKWGVPNSWLIHDYPMVIPFVFVFLWRWDVSFQLPFLGGSDRISEPKSNKLVETHLSPPQNVPCGRLTTLWSEKHHACTLDYAYTHETRGIESKVSCRESQSISPGSVDCKTSRQPTSCA